MLAHHPLPSAIGSPQNDVPQLVEPVTAE